jgi:hypothetical protein
MHHCLSAFEKKLFLVFAIFLAMTAIFVNVKGPANAQETIPVFSQGGNIIPARNTGVELFDSEVLLKVLPLESTSPEISQSSSLCELDVTARWRLKNPGKVSQMTEIWFPLSSMFSSTDNQIEMDLPLVQVDNLEVTAERVDAVFPPGIIMESSGAADYSTRGWAVIKVKIPAETTIPVQIQYHTRVNGLRPVAELEWQFGLGSPWVGKIGKTTLTIEFPYEVNDLNFIGFSGESIFNQASSGSQAQFSTWDVEPKQNEVWKFSFLLPGIWSEVLAARQEVQNRPGDGAAWARLGSAYSVAARLNEGTLRSDDGGTRLALLAEEALRQAILMMPQDTDVHLNLAELLMSTYAWSPWESDPMSDPLLLRIYNEIEIVRQIDPDNERANALNRRLSAYYIPRGLAIDPSAVVQIPTPTLIPTALPTSTPVICPTAQPCECPEVPQKDTRLLYLVPLGGLIFLVSLVFLAFKFRK